MPKPTRLRATYDGLADLYFCGRRQTGQGAAIALFDRYSTERIATLKLASGAQLADALAGAEGHGTAGPDHLATAGRLERAAGSVEADIAEFLEVMQCETGATTLSTIRDIRAALQLLRRAALRLRHAAGGEDGDYGHILSVCADARPLLVLAGARPDEILSAIFPALLGGQAAIIRASLEAPLTTGLIIRHLFAAGFDAGQMSLLHLDEDLTTALMASGRVKTLLSWLMPVP